MLEREHPFFAELAAREYSQTETDLETAQIPEPRSGDESKSSPSKSELNIPLDIPKESPQKRKRERIEQEDLDWKEGDDENAEEESVSDNENIDEEELTPPSKKRKTYKPKKIKEPSPSDSQESKEKDGEKTQFGVADFQLIVQQLLSLMMERSKRVISGQKVIETNRKLDTAWKSYKRIFEILKSTHPLYEPANSCIRNIDTAYFAVTKSNHRILLPIADTFLEMAKEQLNDICEKLNKPQPSSEPLPEIHAVPMELINAKKRKKRPQLTTPIRLPAVSFFKPISLSKSESSTHDSDASSSHSHSHSHSHTPAQPIPVAAPSFSESTSAMYISMQTAYLNYTTAVERQQIAAVQYQQSTEAVMSACAEMKKMTDQFMATGSKMRGLFDRNGQPDTQPSPEQAVSRFSLVGSRQESL